jgi:hypothetical protein
MKSSKNYAIVMLVMVAAALSIIAWRQHGELEGYRASALSSDERADLQKRIWDSQKKVQEMEHKLAQGAPARPVASPLADSASSAPQGANGGLASNLLSRMTSPEAQRLLAEQMRAQIDKRYAALFPKLNLTPEQRTKFEDLLVDRQTAPMDVLSAANDGGISNPQDFMKLVESAQADIDAQIKTALGDSNYGQFQQFQQGQAAQNVVNQLKGSLNSSAAPLTPEQSAQLTQVLAQSGTPSGGAGPFGPSGGPQITNDVITQAQGFLTPPQAQALQNLQQQQQTQQRLRQILIQNSTPPPAGP